jgi:hypothetical protein
MANMAIMQPATANRISFSLELNMGISHVTTGTLEKSGCWPRSAPMPIWK